MTALDLSARATLAFRVFGIPRTKGSVTAFVPAKPWATPPRRPNGSIIVTVKNAAGPQEKSWAKATAERAKQAMARRGVELAPPGVAVAVQITFWMPRGKGHYGTGRNAGQVKPSAPHWPLTSADVDKMIRSALDALTGVVYADDRQVVELHARKVYAEQITSARMDVRVWFA